MNERGRNRTPPRRLAILRHEIAHRYIKPATPRLNGKVGRSHRIDAEEFCRLLDGVMIDDTQLFNDKLAEWERIYNHRPHGPDGQVGSDGIHARDGRSRGLSGTVS